MNTVYISVSVVVLTSLFLSYSVTFSPNLNPRNADLFRGMLSGAELTLTALNVRYCGLFFRAATDREALISELRKRAKLAPEEATALPDADG